MRYLFIRHSVRNFDAWKIAYDADRANRDQAGLKEVQLLRNSENPDDVFLLFEAADPAKASAFAQSADLRTRMERAGVVGRPELHVLES